MTMNTTSAHDGRIPGAALQEAPVVSISPYLSKVLRTLGRTLESWQERVHQRRHLLELDERLLRDIGLSRYDVEREAAKPFWRP
jgi:uncharacterized protein YjiS (DUF1127 family)